MLKVLLLATVIIFPNVVLGQANIPPPILDTSSTHVAGYGSEGVLGPPVGSSSIFLGEETVLLDSDVSNLKEHFALFLSIVLFYISVVLYRRSALIYRQAYFLQFRQMPQYTRKDKPSRERYNKLTEKIIKEGDFSDFEIPSHMLSMIILIMLWIFWMVYVRFGPQISVESPTLAFLLIDTRNHPLNYALIFFLAAFLSGTLAVIKFFQSYLNIEPKDSLEKSLARISFQSLIIGAIALIADLIGIGTFLIK